MIEGWIDFERFAPDFNGTEVAPARVRDGVPEWRIDTPGLNLSFPGAEIFRNRAAIVLAQASPRFRSGDAQRIANEQGVAAAWHALYLERGIDAVSDAKGAFAVVVLDLPGRVALLAVDRFSIRNLYFSCRGARLSFSERADRVPLLAERQIDPQAVFDYLYFHAIPAPRTVFRDVERIPAGHVALFANNVLHTRRYWNPRFGVSNRAPLAELKAEFRQLFREAVAREVTTGSVGCFLSGGTDSSTIAGMLGEVTQTPARTFSIGFDATGYDEMEYARIAARHFRTEHHERYITPADLIRAIPAVAAHYDQPFGNSSALPAYHCARMARESGVTKLLAGDGGDELFGGNTRYAKQKLFAAYGLVPATVRRALIEPLLLGIPGADRLPVVRKLASYVRQARMPMPDRMNSYNLLARIGVAGLLEPDFIAAVDLNAPASAQRETYAAGSGRSLVDRMLEYDWKYTLADSDLPKVSETAALAGVLVGFPFLADEVVDFSLRLPATLKVKGLRLRHFFKEALRGFLPEAIITKRKHGFGLPFGVWLTRNEDLRSFAAASLVRLEIHGIVRPASLHRLLSHQVPEHPAFYGEMVWVLLMLEHWLAARAPKPAVADIPPLVTTS